MSIYYSTNCCYTIQYYLFYRLLLKYVKNLLTANSLSSIAEGHWPVSQAQAHPHTPTGNMVMVGPSYPPPYHLGPPPSYPSSHAMFPHSSPTTPTHTPHPQQPILPTPDTVSPVHDLHYSDV